MELTRLRRELRKGESQCWKDAQALLDAVDGVYEDAERYEDWLGQGVSPNACDIDLFIYENATRLVQLLLDMESVGIFGVLDAVLESQGYERALRELESWKLREKWQKEVEMPTEPCRKQVSEA